MIGYLFGRVLKNEDGKILLGIGDIKTGGVVGYSVTVPQHSDYLPFAVNESLELFIYSHVREDAFDLYGFKSQFEKTLFLTLLTVSGIGPKGALNILSHGSAQGLITAILQKDIAYLTKIPGLGKKTAERLIVELRDLIQKRIDTGVLGYGSQPKHPVAESTGAINYSIGNEPTVVKNFNDAKAALIGLGYRESEALALLNQALTQIEPAPQKTEDLIRAALQQLGK